jgi:hypothetical protein
MRGAPHVNLVPHDLAGLDQFFGWPYPFLNRARTIPSHSRWLNPPGCTSRILAVKSVSVALEAWGAGPGG